MLSPKIPPLPATTCSGKEHQGTKIKQRYTYIFSLRTKAKVSTPHQATQQSGSSCRDKPQTSGFENQWGLHSGET